MHGEGEALALVLHARPLQTADIQRGAVTLAGVMSLSTQPQILPKESSDVGFSGGNRTTSQHLLCLICALTRKIFLAKTHFHQNAFIQVRKPCMYGMPRISMLELSALSLRTSTLQVSSCPYPAGVGKQWS